MNAQNHQAEKERGEEVRKPLEQLWGSSPIGSYFYSPLLFHSRSSQWEIAMSWGMLLICQINITSRERNKKAFLLTSALE